VPFVGGTNFDGVAISADGTNWFEVQGLRTLPGVYVPFIVNLDAAVAARGVTYNSTFRIRFNQYDNTSVPTDGITIDDIAITGSRPGDLHHFSWDAITSSQQVNVVFPCRIAARDAFGTVLTNFAGALGLSGRLGDPTGVVVGSGTNEWDYPLQSFYHDARTQVIYLGSEIGGAGQLSWLALDVTRLPPQTLSNWTIRMRHTSLTNYTSAAWEGSGWTTIYQSNVTLTATGWVKFPFHAPFAFDGTNNLLVDFSFNNSAYTTNGVVRSMITTQPRTLSDRTDSGFGDPLNWSGVIPRAPQTAFRIPNVRFGLSTPVLITPTNSGSFINGVWQGQVTVLQPASNLFLRCADPAGREASANAIDVVPTGHNSPPVVSLVSPTNNSVFVAPAVIVISAQASDAGGSVRAVEFYADASPLGQDTLAPFAVTWTNVPAGTYVLAARATDNLGTNTTSAGIMVKVVPPLLLQSALRLPDGRFQFVFAASSNCTYLVEASTNLTSWGQIVSLPGVEGSLQFTEVVASDLHQRFFRVRVTQ
jgi:hypothetical protein